MAVLCLPDISTDWVRATLEADATLLALTVTQNGVARAVQAIYYLVVPQEVENPYPCIIVDSPLPRFMPQHLNCNGIFITSATFWQDVRFVARDVEPDDAGLRAIKARAQFLLEGRNGSVTGGLVTSCKVQDFPIDQRDDKGSFIYSEKSITFQISTQTT